MFAASGWPASRDFAPASVMPITRGICTSFFLQFAVRVGPRPEKYETRAVSRQ